jgi:calcineurin-like phosphoesterase family protein
MPRDTSEALPQPVFHEPTFSEGKPSPDPEHFWKKHPSDNAQYAQIKKLLTKDVVGFDASRGAPGDLYQLQDALGPHGPETVETISKNGQIVFHAIGDSGASNAGKYKNEIHVADWLSNDCNTADVANRPAFLYHLGDVVYNFGEAQYYYDQFYDPFRNYPAPIFAIPGNHDSFVVPGTAESDRPLTTFARNFCATHPTITAEAASLHRTAMTQPGIYFALDAPFVRIIGLFSNALEDPGVISSEGGKWANVPDYQLDFLAAQLKQLKQENYKGAILLAVHHPPFSYSPPKRSGSSGGNHGSSSAMLRQIDSICLEQGIYPHAFLSGHAHNYQRYTRTIQFGGKEIDVPFLVCGDSGHNANALVQGKRGQPALEPDNGINVDYLESKPAVKTVQLLLEKHDDKNYGYLRVSVNKEQLRIGFHQVGTASLPQSRYDMVTVDLASRTMVSN